MKEPKGEYFLWWNDAEQMYEDLIAIFCVLALIGMFILALVGFGRE